MSNTPIKVHSDLALHLASPGKQILTLRDMLEKSGLSPDRRVTKPPMTWFRPQTPTEVLLLTCTLPGGGHEMTPTARTLDWLWGVDRSPEPFKVNIDVNLKTLRDLAEDGETIGYRWVGFDPLGVVVPSDRDFRADMFIGRMPSRIPPLDYFPAHREPSQLAGVEAFMAARLMPLLIREAWSDFSVLLPRLEAAGTENPRPGAITLTLREDALLGWVNWWEHNYYGHVWIAPTIRELT